MNALNLLCLVVAAANAQLIPGQLPYTHNFLHTNAFRTVAGTPLQYTVGAPVKYTVGAPVKYTVAAAAPAPARYTFNSAPLPVAAPAPVAYTTAAVAPAVVAPNTRTSQFHAQDEFGQYNFGYAGGPSSRHETRDAFGVVRGSFNYVDANGEVQTQSYIADAGGFRVAATDLPVAPEAGDAPTLAGPEPVMETAEVALARAAHQKAYDEAAAAAAAAPDTFVRRKRSVGSVAIHSAVSPLRFSYGFNTVHPYSYPFTTYAAGHAVAPAAIAPAAALTYTTGHAVAPAAVAPIAALTYAAGHPVAPAFAYTAGHAVAPAVAYTGAVAPVVTYTAAAPAVAATHDAELLRVENNPGHAVSYRVY